MKCVKKENGAVCLIDAEGIVWADIKSAGKTCALVLHNDKIPDIYCKDRTRREFSCEIVCESEKRAEECRDAIALLIHSGYKKNWDWTMQMDMEDLADFFGDHTLRFLPLTFKQSEIKREIKRIRREIPKKQSLLLYVRSSSKNYAAVCETIYDTMPYYLIQYSYDAAMKDKMSVFVFYRDEDEE